MKGARGAIGYMGRYDPGMLPIDLQKAYKIPFRDIINLGSNENPFPPGSKMLERLNGDLRYINRYPDTDSSELKSKIAEYTKLNPENVSIGAGANEIFDSICKIFLDPLDEVVIPLPTYTMYLLLSMIRDACPYLLNGFYVSGEHNLCLFYVSEDISTLESIVDGHLRSNPQVTDANLNIIVSPIKNMVMPLTRDVEKTDTPACGSYCTTSCNSCRYYEDDRCMGCPTTNYYKGELW